MEGGVAIANGLVAHRGCGSGLLEDEDREGGAAAAAVLERDRRAASAVQVVGRAASGRAVVGASLCNDGDGGVRSHLEHAGPDLVGDDHRRHGARRKARQKVLRA